MPDDAGTPLLRADATDDDLQLDSEEPENDSAETPDDEDGTVEPVSREVPVIVGGVLHGYRKEGSS